MQLTSLPLDVVACVVDELVSSCDLVDGLQLRLVNRLFDREILRAYFLTEFVDFHAVDVIGQARRMSKFYAARLLHGKLLALDRYGPKAPWLYRLNEAVQILLGEIRTHSAMDSTPEPEIWKERRRLTAQKVSDAVTEYLGVFEILLSLDPKWQRICCREHYLNIKVIGLQRCEEPLEPSKLLRRSESALDWAILTAFHVADHLKVQTLVELYREEFELGLSPTASLQCAARRGDNVMVRLLLDAGADVNGLAHAGHNYVDWYNEYELGSALEAACVAGHYEIVMLLLCDSYGLETSGEVYENAIRKAAHTKDYHNSINIIQLLMSKITCWLYLEPTSECIFMTACSNGNLELATFIFEYAPFNLTAFMPVGHSYICAAIKNDHINIVAYILSQYHARADSIGDPKLELTRATKLAARRGQLQAFALLWEEPGVPIMNHWLFEAVHSGQVEIVKFLVDKGLNLSSRSICPYISTSTSFEKALIEAVEYGQVSVTEYLLELGVRTHRLRPFFSRYAYRVNYPSTEYSRRCKAVEALLLDYNLGPVPLEPVPERAGGVQSPHSKSISCSCQY